MASAAGTTSGVLVVKTVWLANELLRKNSHRPAASKALKIKRANREIIEVLLGGVDDSFI